MIRLFQLTLAVAFASYTGGQTLRVQILDGKTGKPVAHEHVKLFRDGDFSDLIGSRDIHGFTTDEYGIIETSQIATETKTAGVAVDWHRPCLKVFRLQWFPLPSVMAIGAVSENSCNAKLHTKAEPGMLIFFVRKETFFEKMAH
jgi:hypothetical protein